MVAAYSQIQSCMPLLVGRFTGLISRDEILSTSFGTAMPEDHKLACFLFSLRLLITSLNQPFTRYLCQIFANGLAFPAV